MEELIDGLEITMVNLYQQTVTHPQITARTGDACNLIDFADQSFDVVFSNSVIEHLGSLENQQRMASEVRRVGRRYYIQTPSRTFPLEPHYVFPLAQFLPRSVRIQIGARWKFGSYCTPGDLIAAARVADEIRLLTSQEMQALFPSSTLHLEHIGPLVKSITAAGKGEKSIQFLNKAGHLTATEACERGQKILLPFF
jgi:hypothetical protein